MADKSLNRDTSKLDPTTWDHGWGYRDTRLVVQSDECVIMTGSRYNLCGYPMPYLIPFVREELAFDIDFRAIRPRTAVPYVAALRADQFSTDDRERLIHSHGQTTTDEVSRVLYGNLPRAVDLVVWPESEEDCVAVVNLAREHDVCLIPYGGGTNVSDALQVPVEEIRMVVSLDMRRMNAIEWIDAENQTACVQAGILGRGVGQEGAQVLLELLPGHPGNRADVACELGGAGVDAVEDTGPSGDPDVHGGHEPGQRRRSVHKPAHQLTDH